MKENKETNSEAFEKMLFWLDADRTIAARRYEAIRVRLIKFFDYRRCVDSDALADQVFDRVLAKMDVISDGGNPAAYFFKVANFIYRENLRKPVAVELPKDLTVFTDDDDYTPQLECLKICLKTLSAENHRLVIAYYEDETTAKINSHKKIAADLGIDTGALYTKIFRLRRQLQKCVLKCVAESK